MTLILSPAAEKFIRRALRFDGGPGSGFRLEVAPGGCSGLSARFSVEAAPLPGDTVLDLAGTRLFLPAQSRLLLDGVTVDFAETPTESGFVFTDPRNPGGRCGTAGAGSARTVGAS